MKIMQQLEYVDVHAPMLCFSRWVAMDSWGRKRSMTSVGCAEVTAQRVSSRKAPSQRTASLSVRSFLLFFVDVCADGWNANRARPQLKHSVPSPKLYHSPRD